MKGLAQSASCWRLVSLWILWFRRGVAAVAGSGFCMDHVPNEFQGTGYVGVSALTREQCESSGHKWCPASARVETYQVQDGSSVEYYRFSPCCSGIQGSYLIVDATGLPTCHKDFEASRCSRMRWQHKLKHDLIGEESQYDMEVAPSSLMMDESMPGGVGHSIKCICSPDDAKCSAKSKTGHMCLLCETQERCSDYAIRLGINFFKIHTIDIKTSVLVISSWLRHSWVDERLAWNPQCYGGMDFLELQAEAGSLENSRIWVPDIELYNGEKTIWQGSFSARLAKVSSCPVSPSTDGCGSVFWSRPGRLQALCKFQGLSMFPHDQISCELEFAAWSIDGRFQDIVVSSNGGITWDENPNSPNSQAGITAGASDFQDYKIVNITSRRIAVFYDTHPEAPFPEIIFKITIARAQGFYIFKIIVPGIGLVCISFITYWMDPAIGERLGFTITVVLAMVAQEITASAFLPVCNFRVLWDYLSTVSMLFGALSVVETGLVLYLYHQDAETWQEVLFPAFIRKMFIDKIFRKNQVNPKQSLEERLKTFSMTKDLDNPSSSQASKRRSKFLKSKPEISEKDARIRKQIFRELFFILDRNFDGVLDIWEIVDFLETVAVDDVSLADQVAKLESGSVSPKAAVTSPQKSRALGRSDSKKELLEKPDYLENLLTFMAEYDEDGSNSLQFEEFVKFCDIEFEMYDDLESMSRLIKGFIHTAEQRRRTITRMWQARAHMVDRFARWSVPGGFFFFLNWLYSMDMPDLEELMESGPYQTVFTLSGIIPIFICAVICILYTSVKGGVWGACCKKGLPPSGEVADCSQCTVDSSDPVNSGGHSLQKRRFRPEDEVNIAELNNPKKLPIPGSKPAAPAYLPPTTLRASGLPLPPNQTKPTLPDCGDDFRESAPQKEQGNPLRGAARAS